MSYLLDTNVLSELLKPSPTPSVLKWINTVDNEKFYISVITLGEIRKGITGIQNSERQKKISYWLEIELPAYFEERILNIDAKIADMWGCLQNQKKGRILPAIDGLIAATARVHHFKLVTRNTKDFIHTPIEMINPWEIAI
jgi:predicted nucleic acid-binding protein